MMIPSHELPEPVLTFGPGSTDMLTQLLTVEPAVLAAVLPAGVPIPEGDSPHDLYVFAADEHGVTGFQTDDGEPTEQSVTIPWEQISHIHLY